jgi:LmbE family N-acetylglucosaminyl deacetylase
VLTWVQKALVLAPHTDDGEFGCGATIARLVEQGADVHYLAFSDCREAVPDGFPADVLVAEVTDATRTLGIPHSNLQIAGFTVRQFKQDRQGILDLLVETQRRLDPDLVLMPSQEDLHQDHQTVAREALRAFKRTTVLSYEIPWNNVQFQNQAFVAVEERHLQAKIAALACYRSQAGRYYATEEFLRAQAVFRGVQVATRFAEVFEVVRAVFR